MQRSILSVVTLVYSVSLAAAQTPDAAAIPRTTAAPKTEVLPTLPPKRFVIGLPSADKINNNGLALSPDGETLVYIGNRGGVLQLFRRSMDQLEAVPIPATEGAQVPFFSPDGQWIGFFTEDKLKKVALAGGPAVTLCEISSGRWGASWGLDGTIAFSLPGSGLLRVPAVGGVPQPLIKVQVGQGESHRWPDILPNGKAVLFTVFPGTLEEAYIAVANLETGQHGILLKGTQPRYVRTGHLVFARPGSLWAVPFDADRLELTGAPAPLLEDIQVNGSGLANYATADDGSLVYLSGAPARQVTMVWVDRQGAAQPLEAPPRAYTQPQLSPDGRQLTVTIQHEEGAKDHIWVYDLARGSLTRLTFEGSNHSSAWTPDGKGIVFQSTREGRSNLFWKPADVARAEEQITNSERSGGVSSISPDGKLAFYRENHPTNREDIWVVPLEGERKPSLFLQTPFDELVPQISPDGHWLAYLSDESGRFEVYVRPFPSSSGKWQISTEGGVEPLWARDGQELYYRSGDKVMAVEITMQPSFQAGTPRLLFEGSYTRRGAIRETNFDVWPDGQRFLMLKPTEQETAPTQINVVLNWFEELKRKVPTAQ
ncbi:MAG: PD40 domain-containing protein [Acidobacteria bacterium]|nr:PD40 domain-containing protein [Acidobacteriota bacterium]